MILVRFQGERVLFKSFGTPRCHVKKVCEIKCDPDVIKNKINYIGERKSYICAIINAKKFLLIVKVIFLLSKISIFNERLKLFRCRPILVSRNSANLLNDGT